MARNKNVSERQRDEHDAAASSQGRPRRVRRTPRWLIALPLFFIFAGLSTIISANYTQYREYQEQADSKASQLSALEAQHDTMKRRLAFLQLPKGREQTLLEHGYIRPGDRILLFPSEPKTTNSVRKTTPIPVTQAPVVAREEGGTAWSRAARSVSRWWHGSDEPR